MLRISLKEVYTLDTHAFPLSILVINCTDITSYNPKSAHFSQFSSNSHFSHLQLKCFYTIPFGYISIWSLFICKCMPILLLGRYCCIGQYHTISHLIIIARPRHRMFNNTCLSFSFSQVEHFPRRARLVLFIT